MKLCNNLLAIAHIPFSFEVTPPHLDREAAAGMDRFGAAVGEDGFVIAGCVLKCIGEYRHGGEFAGVVHLLCKGYHGGGQPGGGRGCCPLHLVSKFWLIGPLNQRDTEQF